MPRQGPHRAETLPNLKTNVGPGSGSSGRGLGRGLVTDSSACTPGAASRSGCVHGARARGHPGGPGGPGRPEAGRGLASFRAKGAGYLRRERPGAPARGRSPALTSLGGLDQRHPSGPLAVFLLVLVLEIARDAGAGVTVGAAVMMVPVPLLVALMLGPGRAHRQGREGEEGRGAWGWERGGDSGPGGGQRRRRRRRQEQRFHRARDGRGCVRWRQRPGMLAAATPPVRGSQRGVLARPPPLLLRPPTARSALPLHSPRRDPSVGLLLPLFVRLLLRRHRPYYAHSSDLRSHFTHKHTFKWPDRPPVRVSRKRIPRTARWALESLRCPPLVGGARSTTEHAGNGRSPYRPAGLSTSSGPARWAARSLLGAVVPPPPAACLAARAEERKESVRRVTLRAATQPPLGGELPPTALTAQTMFTALRGGRRVPIIFFLSSSVILRGPGGLHSYFKWLVPLLTFVRQRNLRRPLLLE